MSFENDSSNDEQMLDALWERYRMACPPPEASPQFMPALWQKIESRQSFWYAFGRWGRPATTVSAALCLLLLMLNLLGRPGSFTAVPTYTDALMADHSAEKTYYAEAIRNTSSSAPGSTQPAH